MLTILILTTFLTTLMPDQGGENPSGEGTPFVPVFNPEMTLSPRTGSIIIDGDLTDEGWKSAARSDQFTQHWPQSLVKPPVTTEAMMTFDESYLYIAIRAEGDPQELRASLRDRDEIWNDDYVGILLDTYGTANWYYEIFVNPLGVQGDLVASNQGEDIGADFIFQSEGQVTPTGYQVEIAIPFSNLRFPDADEQIWKMTFWRDHKSSDRKRYSWAAINRDNSCFPCQFGTVRGITGISRPSTIDVLPYLVVNQSSERESAGNMEPGPVLGEVGLSAKYQVSPELVTELTLNPDFSQIESDAAQIDVNSNFALFYEERRPFFQEGSDLFQSPSNVVYTRRINAPDVAAKLTGRTENLSYVYLIARDEFTPILISGEERSDIVQDGESWSNIGRIRYSMGNNSSVGAIITDRRYSNEGTNTVGGVDGNYRFGDSFNVTGQFLVSHTSEPNDSVLSDQISHRTFDGYTAGFDGESYNGWGALIRLDRYTDTYNFETQASAVTGTFRADNGFINQNNIQEYWFWNGYNFYPEIKGINQIRPGFVIGQNLNMDGVSKDEFLRFQVNVDLTNQNWFNVQYLINNERFRDRYYSQINRVFINAGSSALSWMTINFYGNYGTQIARRQQTYGLGGSAGYWLSFRPTDQLVIEPGVDYFQLEDKETGEEFYEGYIFRMRMKYQFTRELSARLIAQYDEFSDAYSLEPLVSYKMNPFSVFYAGMTSNWSPDPFLYSSPYSE